MVAFSPEFMSSKLRTWIKISTLMQCKSRKEGHLKISEVAESVCPWDANPAAWLLMIRSHAEDFYRSWQTWVHRQWGNRMKVRWRMRNWLIVITRRAMDLESKDGWMERFPERGLCLFCTCCFLAHLVALVLRVPCKWNIMHVSANQSSSLRCKLCAMQNMLYILIHHPYFTIFEMIHLYMIYLLKYLPVTIHII